MLVVGIWQQCRKQNMIIITTFLPPAALKVAQIATFSTVMKVSSIILVSACFWHHCVLLFFFLMIWETLSTTADVEQLLCMFEVVIWSFHDHNLSKLKEAMRWIWITHITILILSYIPNYRSFLSGICRWMDSPNKWPRIQSFDFFLIISPNRIWKKQLSFRT